MSKVVGLYIDKVFYLVGGQYRMTLAEEFFNKDGSPATVTQILAPEEGRMNWRVVLDSGHFVEVPVQRWPVVLREGKDA